MHWHTETINYYESGVYLTLKDIISTNRWLKKWDSESENEGVLRYCFNNLPFYWKMYNASSAQSEKITYDWEWGSIRLEQETDGDHMNILRCRR